MDVGGFNVNETGCVTVDSDTSLVSLNTMTVCNQSGYNSSWVKWIIVEFLDKTTAGVFVDAIKGSGSNRLKTTTNNLFQLQLKPRPIL